MPTPILAERFGTLLAAFAGCFGSPSYQNFRVLVLGWVHCLGRHTVTSVVVAAGMSGVRHISVYHRFFARAQWSLDAVGHVIFRLAVAWLPAAQPLYLLADDTLTRRYGKCVSLAAMHHDPLLSHGRKPFFSFGHVWVVLALWVPLPMGPQQGFALPLLFRLYTSSKRGGRTDARSRQTRGKRQAVAEQAHAQRDQRTKLVLLQEMTAIMAKWVGERTLYLVCDSAYAGRAVLADRPANVHVISRLRLDAALWTVPATPRRRRRGHPRRRGLRLPTPKVLATMRRRWQTLTVQLYGQTVTTQVFVLRALWYKALPAAPVRIVLVRDPTGRRKLDAFFCTDEAADAGFILEAYGRRWCLEVTFHDTKQFLGLAEPQCQSPLAVQRTAPFAFVVYDLVLLWFAERHHETQQPAWIVRPWYRRKAAASFLDMLQALRQDGWQAAFTAPPLDSPMPHKSGNATRAKPKRAA